MYHILESIQIQFIKKGNTITNIYWIIINFVKVQQRFSLTINV